MASIDSRKAHFRNPFAFYSFHIKFRRKKTRKILTAKKV